MPEEIPISPWAQAGTIRKVRLKGTEFKTNSNKKANHTVRMYNVQKKKSKKNPKITIQYEQVKSVIYKQTYKQIK